MTSEIRANTLKNRVGLGTVSYTNTGIVVSGIVTANSFSGPFTSDLIVTNDAPKIQLVDTNNNPDYEIIAESGFFTIKDITNNASRIYIESSGTINLANNVNALAGVDVTGDITGTGNLILTSTDA
ncbi:MAG: hypothetical protein VXY93_22060, partial [Pseudomonadota bacterium]|nr:hypothetical protein [Pseudomonadota bacterium]